VRYLGERATDFAINAFSAASSSLGGASVRDETGVPTSAKKFSCPGGEHMQSSRAGCSDAFVKTCGALAGMLTVCPARAVCLTPRNVTSTSPCRSQRRDPCLSRHRRSRAKPAPLGWGPKGRWFKSRRPD
jgi:hypothetical protein